MHTFRDITKEVSRESYTVRVMTPDGIMFVTIVEDANNGRPKPAEILITIGKTGSAITAWANAAAILTSLLLRNGVSVADISMQISNILSDSRTSTKSGIEIRSGPEGLQYALTRYNANRQERI